MSTNYGVAEGPLRLDIVTLPNTDESCVERTIHSITRVCVWGRGANVGRDYTLFPRSPVLSTDRQVGRVRRELPLSGTEESHNYQTENELWDSYNEEYTEKDGS